MSISPIISKGVLNVGLTFLSKIPGVYETFRSFVRFDRLSSQLLLCTRAIALDNGAVDESY